MADIDSELNALAHGQHGLVARYQLRRIGIDPGAIGRRIAAGRLVPVSGRVLRVAGAPATETAALLAAVLDVGPDACVSHESAAGLWGLPGFAKLPAVVTGRRTRARSGAVLASSLHRPRRLLDGHVVEIDHLAVTTPTRTVFDLAGSPGIHPLRLERVLDTAWARGLVSHSSLHGMLRDLAARGRPGITLMRELLAARPADHRPPESGLEARFQELARRAGFRSFDRQVDIGDEGGWIGRVDFVDRRRGLVVEVDSARYHGSLTDRRRDDARHAALRAAGFSVETFTDHELFHQPDLVAARLAPFRWAGDAPPRVLGER